MKTYKWSSKLHNRDRSPQLWVRLETGWQQWDGKPIPGVIAISRSAYSKNGKWSGTDYELASPETAQVVQLLEPFSGWGNTWKDIGEGVSALVAEVDPIGVAREIVRIMRASETIGRYLTYAADDADANEKALAEISGAGAPKAPVKWSIGVETPITTEEPLPAMPTILPGSLVVVEGRAPIWRYGMAIHALHGSPAGAVAVFDPRLGAVVVMTHSPAYRVGEIIK